MDNLVAESGNIERLLVIMGNLPEFLRLSYARRKVSELSSMSESDRRSTIKFAAQCLLALEPTMSTKLVTTWIRALCELEPTMLIRLVESYTIALMEHKDYVNLHLEILVSAYQSLSQECQNTITLALKEALFLSPHVDKTVKMLPLALKNILEYKE